MTGRIYDTVLDPDLWPGVLHDIATYGEAEVAILILEDVLEPTKSVFHLSISDTEWTRMYLEEFLLVNPMRLAMAGRVAAGDVVLTSDFMSQTEYQRSRFSREFLSLRDMVDVAAAILDTTATSITVLSLVRTRAQGFADEAVRRYLELIGPHVRRAASIRRSLDRHKRVASDLAETLNQFDGAVFLLNADLIVVHANDGARELLSEKLALSELGGKLYVHDPRARAALLDAVSHASEGDEGRETRDGPIIFATLGDKTLLGNVVSLVAGSRRAMGTRAHSVAALFVREMRFEMPPGTNALAEIHSLTRREMAVLAAVVECGGAPQAAITLGLTNATVKVHLKSIFRKTGTSRQADLVKLVASMASPFKK